MAIRIDNVVPLARGGTAELFTAHSAGERVVLKIARADRSGAGAALASEASVLATLMCSTPVAPRLVGTTHVDGRDALVLEYITLPTLRTAIARGRVRDPLAVAIAVCESVARVHAAGVVHADLSPENILVDPETCHVRLIDFGLAAAVGRTLAPLATVAYASPERVIDGCRACPTVDVYALGVICFELLAGAPPYEGSARMLRVDHATRRVPRVSECVAVATTVDDAVARAMAKLPEARPADAGELAALLARCSEVVAVRAPPPVTACATLVGFTSGVPATTAIAAAGAVIAHSEGTRHVAVIAQGDGRAAGEQLAHVLRGAGATDVEVVEADVTLDPRGLAVDPVIARLACARAEPPVAARRTPLVGRADVVSAIVRSTATLATIWGDVGVGKSRVAEALVEALARRGVVLHVRAPSIVDLLDLLGEGEIEASEAGVRDRAALAAVAGRGAVAGSAAAPLAAAPGALRQAAARALGRALAGRTLVVDDAHEADPVVLDALELATMDRATGVLVVALARPALAITRPRWSRRAAAADAITLAPLAGEAGRELIRALLPPTASVPGAALDRVVERAGGVPLYIIELVGALQRAAGGTTPGTRGALATDLVDVPAHHDVVAWAVADELSVLPAATRGAVEAIAVAGGALAAAAVAPLFGALADAQVRIELDAGVAISRLVATGLLVERAGVLRFRHDLVRDAVAARVPGSRRTAIHRAMLGLATAPAELAHHAERAGERARAADAWRAAAGAALARHDDLAAEAMLGRALACAVAADAELLRQRGGARARLGRHDAAAGDFAAARELTRASGDRGGSIDVLLDEATALDWSLHHAAGAARVDEATALVGSDEPALRRARLAMAHGRRAWRAGDGERAIAPLREAIELADGLGAAGYETAIASRVMLGFVLGVRRETAAAAAILEQALVEATARGDLLHAAAARLNRYPVHAARGDAAGLRADMAAFAAAGRELGIAVTEYRGELYQALVAVWCDDDAAALDHAQAARRLEAADAALFPRPAAVLVLAELAARAGDRDGATRWYVAARAHGAASAIDALGLEVIETWLADRLDVATAIELAGRAVTLGESEAGYQLLELAARTAARRGNRDAACAARAAGRALPNLPMFIAPEAG